MRSLLCFTDLRKRLAPLASAFQKIHTKVFFFFFFVWPKNHQLTFFFEERKQKRGKKKSKMLAAAGAPCGVGAGVMTASRSGRRFRGSRRAHSHTSLPRASGGGGGPVPRGFSSIPGSFEGKTRESRQHLTTNSESHADSADITRCRAASLRGGVAGPGVRAVSTVQSSSTVTKSPTGSSTSTAAAAAATATHHHVTTSAGYVVQKRKFTVQELPTTDESDGEILRQLRGPESVTLVNDVVRLWVTTDGRLHLRRFGDAKRRVEGGRQSQSSSSPPTERLVARSRVQLPREADALGGVITSTSSDDDGNLVAAEIRWGDVARLRVESTAMVRRRRWRRKRKRVTKGTRRTNDTSYTGLWAAP